MPNQTLHPRLSEALHAVEVDQERRTAHVHGVLVEADSSGALRHALANKLYEVLHAGLDWGNGPRPRTLRDAAFERLLTAAVPHQETALRIPAESVTSSTDPGQRIVSIDEVRTLVPLDALSFAGVNSEAVTLRYPATRPALSAGFFLVDGSAGRLTGSSVVRCYVNVEDAESAPGIWARVLQVLEDRSVRYRAKVSSSPMLYPRRDAIVVYLDAADIAAVDLAAITTGLPGLGRSTSVFVRELALGLGIAAEPSDPRPGMDRMSFGQHRSYALADGVLAYAQAPGSTDTPDVETAVSHALIRANVRPNAPWQNSSDADWLPRAADAQRGANR